MNGINVIVVLHCLDLYFQKFQKTLQHYYSKTLQSSAKMLNTMFIDIDIYYRLALPTYYYYAILKSV